MIILKLMKIVGQLNKMIDTHETQATEIEKLMFKQQKEAREIKLTNEQINYIIQLCENDIKNNENLIKGLRDEKGVRKIINYLRAENKQNSQFVLQKLTELSPSQEDFLIESQLEQMREARENEM